MAKGCLIDSDAYRDRIAVALSQYVGPPQSSKPWTDPMLAEATGQDARTVKAHRLGETPPGGPALLAYMRDLPIEFTNAVIALAGLAGARRIDAAEGASVVLASAARAASVLATALADGHIDHIERRSLPPDLRNAAAALESLAVDLERRG